MLPGKVAMALSRIKGQDELYVGGIWALRRSDALAERRITHVLSLVGFNFSSLRNFKDEPWTEYGRQFQHLVIDIDDVDEANLLVELPRAVQFVDGGLRGQHGKHRGGPSGDDAAAALGRGIEALQLASTGDEGVCSGTGAVLVHCAAGKSRSVAVTVAFLLWKYPNRFDPNVVPPGFYSASGPQPAPPQPGQKRTRKQTAREAVDAALSLIQRSRPMAEPNAGFMEQLALWWEMGCPDDVERHPVYQRWAYRREVEEHVAVGQAPTRLRFEDEQQGQQQQQQQQQQQRGPDEPPSCGISLRCKKCRRTLATAPFIQAHTPAKPMAEPCPHHFVEPLGWMRGELQRGELSGRLACPNERCGAGVGRYDWKGIRCACGAWVTPGLSLQRARVDQEPSRPAPAPAATAGAPDGQAPAARAAGWMGIRMPPGAGNL